MSCLHLNANCPHRWQPECAASTNSKPKKPWSGWSTCTLSECPCWCVVGREWYVHNVLRLVKVGFRRTLEHHSGLNCRSQLCQNFNYMPDNTQQQKLQQIHKYPNCMLATNSQWFGSKVYLNMYDNSATAVAVPDIYYPESDILTQGFNIL